MTICKITVFALVRELEALQRYDVFWDLDALEVEAHPEGDWIKASDFLAVMARNVIPEAP